MHLRWSLQITLPEGIQRFDMLCKVDSIVMKKTGAEGNEDEEKH